MLKIRLSRRGKKRQPSYRVVVTDVNAKRDGRIVERIGHYNPLVDPAEFAIQEDRALHWLSVGAQPTDAVRRLLDKQGTFERLSRLHAGESVDVLAAEVTGAVVAAPEAVEEAAEPEETVEEEEAAEEEKTLVEKAVDFVQDAAAQVVEKVEEAAEAVKEVVEEAVDEVVEEEPEAEAADNEEIAEEDEEELEAEAADDEEAAEEDEEEAA